MTACELGQEQQREHNSVEKLPGLEMTSGTPGWDLDWQMVLCCLFSYLVEEMTQTGYHSGDRVGSISCSNKMATMDWPGKHAAHENLMKSFSK